MTGRVDGADGRRRARACSTELDPARQAFLDDHRIDGTPVLPGRDGHGGLRRGRAAPCCPAGSVVALEDVELLAPFKFYRDEPRTLELRALVRDGGDGTLVADCRAGRPARRCPARASRRRVHFTGRVRLAREAPRRARRRDAPPDAGDERRSSHDAIYRIYFHGPAYQVLDRAWRDDGDVVGRLADDLPPDHEPPERARPRSAPRLIELCFQTAGVLGARHRRAGWRCPTHVDRVVALRRRRRARPRCARSCARARRRRRRRRGGRRERARARAARGLPHDRAARRLDERRARADPRRDGRTDGAACSARSARLAIVNRGEPAMRLIHAVRELNEQRDEPIRVDRALHRARARRDVRARGRRGVLPRPGDGRRRATAAASTATSTTTRSSARSWRRGPTPPGSAGASWPSSPEFAELCERLGIVFVGPERRRHAPRSATRSRPSAWPRRPASRSRRGAAGPVDRRRGRARATPSASASR